MQGGERQRQTTPPEHGRDQPLATKACELFDDARERLLGQIEATEQVRVVVTSLALEDARKPERTVGSTGIRPLIPGETAVQGH